MDATKLALPEKPAWQEVVCCPAKKDCPTAQVDVWTNKQIAPTAASVPQHALPGKCAQAALANSTAREANSSATAHVSTPTPTY